MDINMNAISPIIIHAVELLRTTFGGTEIKILDTEMQQKYPDSYAVNGYWGVTISVKTYYKTHKAYLKCQLADDIIFYSSFQSGKSIRESFIYSIIKDEFSIMKRRYERMKKLEKINEFKS